MRKRLALTATCPLLLLLALMFGAPQAGAAYGAHSTHRSTKRAGNTKRAGDTHGHKPRSRHAGKHKRPRLERRKSAHAPASPTVHGGGEQGAVVSASCKDGSRPIGDEEGAFACADGSEPSCPKALVATVSEDGSTLLCEAEPSEEGEESGVGEDAGELEYDSSGD